MLVWGLRISVATCLVMVLALSIQTCRLNDRDAAIARATLEREGWTLSSSKPKVDDAPAGSRPVVVIEGGVRFLPQPPESSGTTATTDDVSRASSSGGPGTSLSCDLNRLVVDINCRSEVVDLDGVQAGRLFVWGRLFDPVTEQERVLPKTKVGDDRPTGVETKPPEVSVDLPTPRKRSWKAVRVGLLVPDGGWVVGASYGKGLVGGWADYRRRAQESEVGLGIELRW